MVFPFKLFQKQHDHSNHKRFNSSTDNSNIFEFQLSKMGKHIEKIEKFSSHKLLT
jgi:hypothetical protein